MELEPAVQKYHWGKIGSSSFAARLAAKPRGESGIKIEENDRYAELWMGTHPNGPSKFVKTGEFLHDFIQRDSDTLGKKVKDVFGPDLPFLLKVLSVDKALSIQAHPDKELAKELHGKRPDIYKDNNHKPEMAIAITQFEMMCGFRGMQEIINFIENLPELRDIIGHQAAQCLKDTPDKHNLKMAYSKLMTAQPDVVSSKIDCLLQRMRNMTTDELEKIEGNLVQRLQQQFPGDVGIFSVYFFQHITLQPGEAVFLPANEPHAYIHGDCVECMATSDNVVRGGLTPKFKDVPILLDMLNYETGKNWLMESKKEQLSEDGEIALYDAPVPEFSILSYKSNCVFNLKQIADSCSIVICIKGSGHLKTVGSSDAQTMSLTPGAIFYVPANIFHCVVVTPHEELLLYQSYSTP